MRNCCPMEGSEQFNKREDFTEAEIFYALDRLRPTSEGADRLPSWFLKIVAPICSSVLAHLINRSLGSAHVPEQWKLAVITPVPKVPKPTAPTDYRPISVVPVLSRMVERLIVQNYLYRAFQESPMCDDIADQFAFRPTGSTTAAIIELLQQTTDLLLTNDFVVIISTDFSRAFDTVRHSEMMKKYGILVLPDHIVNWLTGYFAERGHITKFQGIMSAIAFINASVVQGSVVCRFRLFYLIIFYTASASKYLLQYQNILFLTEVIGYSFD